MGLEQRIGWHITNPAFSLGFAHLIEVDCAFDGWLALAFPNPVLHLGLEGLLRVLALHVQGGREPIIV